MFLAYYIIYRDESKSLGSKHVRGSAGNDQPSMGREVEKCPNDFATPNSTDLSSVLEV